MARPHKQTEGHRRHRLSVRVTDDELALFNTRVRESGINASDYLRQAALLARIKVAQTTKADPALIAELNRIGVNLNQMARTANGTGRVPPEITRLCEKIEAIVMRAVEEENP